MNNTQFWQLFGNHKEREVSKGVYEIAKFIPLAYRRKMVKPVYKVDPESDKRACATGRCPMGWLFADPPNGRKLPEKQAFPSEYTIARRIKRLFPALTKGVSIDDLVEPAADFTEAWDNGKIRKLSKALGLD